MPPHIAQKVANFFAQYPLQYFEKGHILARSGQEPSGILYLVGGHVRQYDIAPSGDEVVVNIFKPPAFFPMSWAINHTPNTYFYEAFTKIVVRKAPAQEVVRFLRDNPDVTINLLARVYKGTDGLLARMVHLMQNSARARILFELILSCERYGKLVGSKYSISLHETELAARVGLTRETVNREMRKLKKEGLVDVSPQGIIVTKLSALKAEANPEL